MIEGGRRGPSRCAAASERPLTTFETVLLTLLVVDSLELAANAELPVFCALRHERRANASTGVPLVRQSGRHQLRNGIKAGVAAHWKAMSTEARTDSRARTMRLVGYNLLTTIVLLVSIELGPSSLIDVMCSTLPDPSNPS